MTKPKCIKEIKSLISKNGEVSTKDLELDTSPVYDAISPGVIELIERFGSTHITVKRYDNDTEVDEFEVPYEGLTEDMLNDVHYELEQYDVWIGKTMSKIRSNNF